MNDDRAEDALALADAALAHAAREGATEAEALVMAEDAALTRFANSQIHQNVAETNVIVNLRVRRSASGSASRRPADRRRGAAPARREAGCHRPRRRGARRTGAACPDADARSDRRRRRTAPATADATPELRADGVRAVIAAADAAGVTAYGSFSTGTETMAVANSHGVRAARRRGPSSQLLTVSMGAGRRDRLRGAAAVDATTIDAAAIGREAADKARATANAVADRAGDYPVVLEEYAVVDLLDMLGYLGFSALAVQEERSFVEPGKRIGSDLVTIVDDGCDPAGLPMCVRLRGRGQAARPARRARGLPQVVYDAQTAARDGVRSTGHGLPGPEPVGPVPAQHGHDRGRRRPATSSSAGWTAACS